MEAKGIIHIKGDRKRIDFYQGNCITCYKKSDRKKVTDNVEKQEIKGSGKYDYKVIEASEKNVV